MLPNTRSGRLRNLGLTCLILLFFCACASAEEYPSLWQSVDPLLQSKLEKLIQQQGLMQHVQEGHLALALVDISDPYQPHLASLNGDKMVYAASLPKIAILLGAFVQIEAGVLKADDALLSELVLMIRHSDNDAATRMLDRVGRDEILEILQSLRFQLYTKDHNGGIWIGKDYARKGAYRRDPLHNLSHGASVMQAARHSLSRQSANASSSLRFLTTSSPFCESQSAKRVMLTAPPPTNRNSSKGTSSDTTIATFNQ